VASTRLRRLKYIVTTVVFDVILNIIQIESLDHMSDEAPPPCADCTPEEQCKKCKEEYEIAQAAAQVERISTTINALPPEIQTIAMGIVLGLQQITPEQTDDINTFISKVDSAATKYAEIKTFLEDMSKSYLTAWEYDLLMRCLQGLNTTDTNTLENAS
jgi:hypothetical protein